jgi:hypothetical protein
MAAARKKAAEKKATTANADAVEIAWRGKYEAERDRADEVQASLDAVMQSQFRVDWNAKEEELGPRLVDYLRLILTTERGAGRTFLLLREVWKMTQREDPPDFLCVVAAQVEHRKFLMRRFMDLYGGRDMGNRIALGKTKILFLTIAEDKMGKGRGLPGLVRILDHFTVEDALRTLTRLEP